MEAKGRKMVAMGVVVALCAVALIGAGYAAYANGTAKTYNQNNAVAAGYITVSPDGEGAAAWQGLANNATTNFGTYTYGIEVDDDDDPETPDVVQTKTAYYRTDAAATTQTIDAKSYSLYSVGSKVFTVDNQMGAAKNLDFKVTATATVGNADFIYVLSDGTNYYKMTNTGEVQDIVFALGSVAVGESDVTLTMYIGFVVNAYLPAVEYGPAHEESGVGYTQGAHVGTNDPAGFTGLTLLINVVEHA